MKWEKEKRNPFRKRAEEFSLDLKPKREEMTFPMTPVEISKAHFALNEW